MVACGEFVATTWWFAACFWTAKFFLIFEIYFLGGNADPPGDGMGRARVTSVVNGNHEMGPLVRGAAINCAAFSFLL
jgi:hypothetical protein